MPFMHLPKILSNIRDKVRWLGIFIPVSPTVCTSVDVYKHEYIATNLCFSSTKGLSKNIMLLPGHAFMPKNASESPKTINHMRAAFSVASEKDFDVAFERLAELIREEQANQKQ